MNEPMGYANTDEGRPAPCSRGGADLAGHVPLLEREERHGIAFLTDPGLAERGVRIAFSERTGGTSPTPFDSLDLGSGMSVHPASVDRDRAVFLAALGLGAEAGRLTTAHQVHGSRIVAVDRRGAGAGAKVTEGTKPLPLTDALLTETPGVPLMLLFADCVPVVIVAPPPGRAGIVVAHAGWRGTALGLPGKAVRALCRRTSRSPADVLVYVGPCIGPCHYQVPDERLWRFVRRFGTIATASGGLDLGASVAVDLVRAGVDERKITRAGVCTAHETRRFFSYRANEVTGRHAALAAITAAG